MPFTLIADVTAILTSDKMAKIDEGTEQTVILDMRWCFRRRKTLVG